MSSAGYAFIYDDFLNDRKYERPLAELEARLASLDLTGRVGRLTLFRSAKDLIESLVSQGVSTVVIVGNDRTLDKVMWFLPDLDVTLGYLPVDGPSRVAEILGIPVGSEACDILAARLIETVDMGKLDDRYFLTEVALEQTTAAVDIEGKFRISPIAGGSVYIRNLGSVGEQGEASADARDGLLEVVVQPQEDKRGGMRRRNNPAATRIFMRFGEIVSNDPAEVKVDNHVVNSMKFKIGIVPKKLKIITGRRRQLLPAKGGLLKNAANANLSASK